ncbi:protein kinase [Thermodesulfobacteriota bacterium]
MKSRLFTDTTNFISIDCGDEILINGKRYKITGHEREGRFGMTDPKFWVKRALDPDTGEKKIIKLAFFESFEISIGGVKINRFRSPEKEARILETVRGHSNFMQGESFQDSVGNNIRILDIVRGPNFFTYINTLEMDHEAYFNTTLPGILKKLIKLFEAIRFLHFHGHRHGDIRNDHIIVEQESGNYVWIDFDYEFVTMENPFGLDVFGLGNILLYAISMGFHDFHTIKSETKIYDDLKDRLVPEDFSILNQWRLMNIRKLYPYVPTALNDILLHFSKGSDIFYETVEEVIEDLNRCLHLTYT